VQTVHFFVKYLINWDCSACNNWPFTVSRKWYYLFERYKSPNWKLIDFVVISWASIVRTWC